MKNETMTTIKQVFHFIGLFALALLFWAAHLSAADHESVNQDWPQWRGPNRDAISHETDLLKNWVTTGRKETWRIPIGDRFSAISISQGRAYTMEAKGDDEFVVCFSDRTGEDIWRFRSDAFYHEGMGGNGPRATPTIVDDMLFTVSAYGKLYALHANTGEKLWSYDFQKDFGSKMPQWGYSMSPLVYGEKLLVEVGGKEGKSIIAFDKKGGELLWTFQEDVAGYSSPISVTIHDIHQLIFFTGRKLVALSPEDGRLYWQYRWETSYDVNAATPVFIPPDKVFIWKLSLELVRRFDVLFFETLNLEGMKRLWGRKVSDIGFYAFMRKLKWQAKKRGKRVECIDQWAPTTRVCHICNTCVELQLNDRNWTCQHCKTYHDRDINAAINILKVGASTFGVEGVRLAIASTSC